jgi:hypothetical protein
VFRSKALVLVFSSGLSGLIGTAVMAEVAATVIDSQLEDNVDFRSLAFAECFGQTSCDVDLVLPSSTAGDTMEVTLSIAAEKDGDFLNGWVPAEIYWDPIDGFGIMGGGQNDEIDFNERLTVSLSTPLDVSGIWFSDMFISEQSIYGAFFQEQDDLEAADVTGTLGGETVIENRVTGAEILPDDAFNTFVSDTFTDDGDLQNRVLINDGAVSILLLVENDQFANRIIRSTVGQIDSTKLDIFAGVSIVEIDAATLFGNNEFAPVLVSGEHNAIHMGQMLNEQVLLDSVRTASQRQRLVSDVPNGEVGINMQSPVTLDQLVFSAELMTSNDYSVAGFMLEN